MNGVIDETGNSAPSSKRRRTTLSTEAPSEETPNFLVKVNEVSKETSPSEKETTQKCRAQIDDLVSWNNFAAVSHRNALTFGDIQAMKSALQGYQKALTTATDFVPSWLTEQLKGIVDKNALDISPSNRSPSPLFYDSDEEDECPCYDDSLSGEEIDVYDLTDPQELPPGPLSCSLGPSQAHEQYSAIARLFTINVMINIALLLSNSASRHEFCLDLIVAAKEIERELDLSVIRERLDLALILISLHYNDGILQLEPFMDDLVSDNQVVRRLAQTEVERFFEEFIISLSEALNLGNPFSYTSLELEAVSSLQSINSPQEYKNTMNIAHTQVLAGMAYGMLLAGRTDDAREAYSQAESAYQMIAFGLLPCATNGHHRCTDGPSAPAA